MCRTHRCVYLGSDQGLNMMSIRYRPLQNGVGDPNEATLQLWSRHGNQLSAGFVLGHNASSRWTKEHHHGVPVHCEQHPNACIFWGSVRSLRKHALSVPTYRSLCLRIALYAYVSLSVPTCALYANMRPLCLRMPSITRYRYYIDRVAFRVTGIITYRALSALNSVYTQTRRCDSLDGKAIPKDLDVLGCDTPSTGAKWVESSSPAPARILPSPTETLFASTYGLEYLYTRLLSLMAEYGRQDRKLQRYGTPALLFMLSLEADKKSASHSPVVARHKLACLPCLLRFMTRILRAAGAWIYFEKMKDISRGDRLKGKPWSSTRYRLRATAEFLDFALIRTDSSWRRQLSLVAHYQQCALYVAQGEDSTSLRPTPYPLHHILSVKDVMSAQRLSAAAQLVINWTAVASRSGLQLWGVAIATGLLFLLFLVHVLPSLLLLFFLLHANSTLLRKLIAFSSNPPRNWAWVLHVTCLGQHKALWKVDRNCAERLCASACPLRLRPLAR
ncbi:hypothetical protein KC359_g242 [Hortaea werneckii]|nr:hypothetical protein KC359_g242 [Hortaea werneckii]